MARRAFTGPVAAPVAAHALDMPYWLLDRWRRTGVVATTLAHAPSGRWKTQQVFTLSDLVAVGVLREVYRLNVVEVRHYREAFNYVAQLDPSAYREDQRLLLLAGGKARLIDAADVAHQEPGIVLDLVALRDSLLERLEPAEQQELLAVAD